MNNLVTSVPQMERGLARRCFDAFQSPLIDRGAYIAQYGGEPADPMTIAAYLTSPYKERARFCIYFDSIWYADINPDVSPLDHDLLLHFLEHGLTEYRSPHPLIDIDYINRCDPGYFGVRPSGSALADLLNYDLADPSPYFSVSNYLREAKAEFGEVTGCLRHFLSIGLQRGIRPTPLFSPFWYAGNYPDAPRDPYEALRHFVAIGDIEGRLSSPEFDGRRYLKRYPDVANANLPALKHFLVDGAGESRDGLVPVQAAKPSEIARLSQDAAVEQGTAWDARRISHLGFRQEIARQRRARIEAFNPIIPKLQKDCGLKGISAGIVLPLSEKPTVSVLIPIFNETEYTLACLRSISCHLPEIGIEIILADDCSTEIAVADLLSIRNLIVRRQDKNVGFLRNCNTAFHTCRGDYVLLLNNDTQFVCDLITPLLRCIEQDTTIAIAGPKVIYPSGHLQEAGCWIDHRGRTGMVGLNDDPAADAYSYDRDTQYISGAALLIRRSAIEGDLFDPRFEPAYCEDVDLCLRLRAKGLRIRFCADVTIVHHLSISTAKASRDRRLQVIETNQQKLQEKWCTFLQEDNHVRVISFYLPQFHPTPYNDLWWGKGFTEWTNVTRAKPSFLGHYQPHLPADLGYYDLRYTPIFEQQARLSSRYGLHGFCFYYYNFGGRRVLDVAFECLIIDRSLDVPFCVCWANENWTKHWDGGEKKVLLGQSYEEAMLENVISDFLRYAADPRYIRVNGKPIFLVYRPALLPDCKMFTDHLRRRGAEAGFPEIYLAYVESMELANSSIEPQTLGFNAAVEFPPHGYATPSRVKKLVTKAGWDGYRYDYLETAKNFCLRPAPRYKRHPGVFPSWDNTPRQELQGTILDSVSPELFQAYVEVKIDEVRAFFVGEERLLFVNAWNEWAEGAHLEPDVHFGHQWLEAIRDALRAKGIG